MYKTYFGFTEKPFTIAPNPQYLFMSPRHQEALAHMLYAMQGEGGIMVLTGEVGTGKTTLCRHMLAEVPENTDVAYIINPRQSATEMLASLCDELHVECSDTRSIKALTDALNQHLLDNHAKGKHTVLIIDEAQQLDITVLEQLRLLTNLETNDKKLLQIMLLGQPELADVLKRKDLRQFAQRITARYHLTPLTQDEVADYVAHRLQIAGCDKQTLFPKPVLQLLYDYSGGVPRLINLLADRALLGAYASEQKQVSKAILQQAKEEVLGHSLESQEPAQTPTRNSLLPYILLAILIVMALWWWNAAQQHDETTQPIHAQTSEPVLTTPAPQTLVQAEDKVSIEQPPQTSEATPQESDPEPVATASIGTGAADTEAMNAEAAHAKQIAEIKVLESVKLPITHNKNDAFIPVFQSWGLAYNPEIDGEACTFAQSHGLLCLRQRADMAQMRSLNRPAVLTVSDDEGQRAYTAITGLTGSTAQAASQDNYAQIPLSDLALQSFNDFTLLWKAPLGYHGPVRPGHKGKLVEHLATQVTQALHQSWIGSPRKVYDDTLKEQVKILQRQEGLSPDGVAGPITWIHINSLNHIGSPTLNQKTQQADNR